MMSARECRSERSAVGRSNSRNSGSNRGPPTAKSEVRFSKTRIDEDFPPDLTRHLPGNQDQKEVAKVGQIALILGSKKDNADLVKITLIFNWG
jgi:hypothetical protein